jgi:hypothetical protein
MPETWRAVVGHEGDYEVSDHGRVRSLPGHKRRGQVLRGIAQHHGHLMVNPRRDGRMRQLFVHRLVLEAFIGPCPPGMMCRHLNGNPSDNRLENLRWGTPKENAEDSTRHGTHANGNKLKCPSGHEYSPENTATWRGRRFCKTCRKERAAAWRRGQSWPLAAQVS